MAIDIRASYPGSRSVTSASGMEGGPEQYLQALLRAEMQRPRRPQARPMAQAPATAPSAGPRYDPMDRKLRELEMRAAQDRLDAQQRARYENGAVMVVGGPGRVTGYQDVPVGTTGSVSSGSRPAGSRQLPGAAHLVGPNEPSRAALTPEAPQVSRPGQDERADYFGTGVTDAAEQQQVIARRAAQREFLRRQLAELSDQ